MSNKNTENPLIGKAFQKKVQKILVERYNMDFEWEPAIPIGTPPKNHRFDLSNNDRTIVVECKCYTWTDAGNIPSAKLTGLNEAVFYFGFLPSKTIKILCLKQSIYPGKTETLAEYYVRVHGNLLGDVKVFEITDDGIVNVIR